jgi:hypothetical protein
MRKISTMLVWAGLAVGITGCDANFHSIFRTYNPQTGDNAAFDAKQRLVISGINPKVPLYDSWNHPIPPEKLPRVVCAEPSPDAFAVLSAAFSGSANVPEKFAAQLAASSSESGASIGLRTQTITILRDAMYRLCEGYLAGALSERSFERLQRRYQNAMLGLLAIEQLTGAVQAKQAVLTSGSGSGGGKGINEAQKALDTARAELKKAKEESDKTNKALNTEQTTLTTLKAAQTTTEAAAKADPSKKPEADKAAQAVKDQETKVASAKAEADEAAGNVTEAGENVAAAETFRQAALSVDASSAASGFLERVSAPMRPATASAIGSAVENIVKQVIEADYTRETCLQYLVDNDSGRVIRPSRPEDEQVGRVVRDFCLLLLNVQSKTIVDSASSTSASPETTKQRLGEIQRRIEQNTQQLR